MGLFISLIVSLMALAVAGAFAWQVLRIPMRNPKVAEITGVIKVAARAYLARQYKTIAVVAVIIFGFLLIFLGVKIAAGFLIGAGTSALAGYIGMMISVS